ncbi:PAS domain-containing protein [Erythrobacter sp. HA6-11]
MDTLRGPFDTNDLFDDTVEFDAVDEDGANDLPPSPIGQDERRMQVRAYNHWAGLLGERNYPSIEDLDPANIDDFGPFSVLLDFSKGIEDPSIQFLGEELAQECGTDSAIKKLSDVPSRSLLSRITDHYMQILANQAPIGFEAEFINDDGITIMYRGILLPYSSDDETIDFIYGVINWKEMADRLTADELLLEIDNALEGGKASEPAEASEPEQDALPLELTDGWADGPADHDEHFDVEEDDASDALEETLHFDDNDELPTPDFGHLALEDEEEDDDGEGEANYDFASLTDHVAPPKPKDDALELGMEDVTDEPYSSELWSVEEPQEEGAPSGGILSLSEEASIQPEPAPDDVLDLSKTADPASLDDEIGDFEAHDTIDLAGFEQGETENEDAGLYDCLASARELAETARTCEDRSRSALYAAVGRAYDVSLAAQEAPEEYAELIADNGLSVQERAPMTPVVKLVFGAEYDKTRLTEYAAVLSHAHRVGIERGALAEFLDEAEGGLKGVVSEERRIRKEEAGETVEAKDAVRSALAKKLRKLDAIDLESLAGEGGEFGLVMIRRTEDGDVELIGEVADDIPLIERAARKLLG